ncbi:MAG TPA: biopolymer transporter ExbD [Polyangiaceae bacterium]|nr:biopolymer transporter ExbD [Polyangiaceae bacterium]
MANISVGGDKSGRRALDFNLPLVPFVDFMVCLIAFLLVTAVWTQFSRLEASARVPGAELGSLSDPPKELHVVASAQGFELRWQLGPTVLDTLHVARAPTQVGSDTRFPTLSEAITKEWLKSGEHRVAGDPRLDRAVLHVANNLPFAEVVAVLDAIHSPRGGKTSAFDVAFSAN